MTLSLLFLYSLYLSGALLLMYAGVRLSRVNLTRYGRPAILLATFSSAIAAALPLIIGWHSRPEIILSPELIPMIKFDLDGGAVSVATEQKISRWSIFCTIYIIGLIIAALRVLRTILKINLLALRAEARGDVLISDDAEVPFSWGSYIIMSRADFEANGAMLRAHEMAHKSARHWLDLLMLNLLGCLTWYCPAIPLLRRQLQACHEFEADRAVIRAGFDAQEYQMLLISKASGRRFANSVTDSINNHPLKQRIIMMQKKSTLRHGLLRSLALIPVGLAVFALASSSLLASPAESLMPAKISVEPQKEEIKATPSEQNAVEAPQISPENTTQAIVPSVEEQSQTSVKEEKTTAESPKKEEATVADELLVVGGSAPQKTENSSDEKTFTEVEQGPQFPGGETKMFEFLSKSIRYPAECAERNIQGRVVVQFQVLKDGSIGQVKVVRGVDPQLDGEAVRIVRTFPKFIPGTMNGEPVNVWYTLPVNFKLQ